MNNGDNDTFIVEEWELECRFLSSKDDLHKVNPEKELEGCGYVFEPHWQITGFKWVGDQGKETGLYVPEERADGKIIGGVHLHDKHIRYYKPITHLTTSKNVRYAIGLQYLRSLTSLTISAQYTGSFVLEHLPLSLVDLILPSHTKLEFTMNGGLQYNNNISIQTIRYIANTGYKFQKEESLGKNSAIFNYMGSVSALTILKEVMGRQMYINPKDMQRVKKLLKNTK